MKTSTFVIAALFASVQADAPPYFNEPPFAVATHPAAAGLVQLQSACANSGISGVTCGPSDEELFATGMNGDEDLGEDITMKGDKFHFVQNVQLSAEPEAAPKAEAAPEAKAEAAPEAKAEAAAPAKAEAAAPAKAAAEAPAKGEAAAPAKKAGPKNVAEEKLEAKEQAKSGKPVYSTKGYGPVEKISFFDPKVAKAHTSFYAQNTTANATANATTDAATTETQASTTTTSAEPEKVSILDPKIAKAHTTFYNNVTKQALSQAEPAAEEKAPVPAGTAAPSAPAAEKKGKVIYDTTGYGPVEKISFFDPKIAKAHTSFYAQAEGIPKMESAETFTGVKNFPYPGPEQVHTLDPKIAKGHNTFYAQQ